MRSKIRQIKKARQINNVRQWEKESEPSEWWVVLTVVLPIILLMISGVA